MQCIEKRVNFLCVVARKKHTPQVFSALRAQVPQQEKEGFGVNQKACSQRKRRKVHVHQRAFQVFVDPFAQYWCKMLASYLGGGVRCLAVLLLVVSAQEAWMPQTLSVPDILSDWLEHDYRPCSCDAPRSAILVASWPAILRLRLAGCDLGSAKLHKYRGGLGLRFSNRSRLRPVAIWVCGHKPKMSLRWVQLAGYFSTKFLRFPRLTAPIFDIHGGNAG